MGAYVYRVTEKRVICSDGKPANVAVFTYKPSYNSKPGAYAQALIAQSRNLRRTGQLSDRIVTGFENWGETGNTEVPHDATVYRNPRRWATFVDDDNLGVPGRLPILAGIRGAR